MSLYRQNALIQAGQVGLLGEIFEYFELDHPLGETRDTFLTKIADSLGFEQKYIDKAIQGENRKSIDKAK